MAFFGRETMRLVRDYWLGKYGPRNLAEELYTILKGDLPITQDAPMTLNNGTPGPALTINNTGDGDTVIQINRNNDPVGAITIGSDGGLHFGGTAASADTATSSQRSSRAAFMGTVVSGTGTTYSVTLDTGASVSVSVPGILGTEQIPVGSRGVVIKLDNSTYQMFFPLWVE